MRRHDYETETETETVIVQSIALRGRDGGTTAELGGDLANALRCGDGNGSKPHVLIGISGQESYLPYEKQGFRIQGTNGVAPTVMANPNGGMKLEPILTQVAVRRLTPLECERLQGFKDRYTLIPIGRGIAKDGPRYKALGNSMAVNVMRHIGDRIQMVESLMQTVVEAA